MSISTRILLPITRITDDRWRRLALLAVTPVLVLNRIAQLLLAPIAVLVILVLLTAKASWDALVETCECAVASTREEPRRWESVARRWILVWQYNQETYAARPRILSKGADHAE